MIAIIFSPGKGLFGSLLFFLILINSAFSQGFNPSDLIRQNKKQRKLLIEQIAANNAYIKLLTKGNSVLDIGVKSIGLSKEGDFNLHSAQFGSLNRINSSIRNSSTVRLLVKRFHELMEAIERILSIKNSASHLLRTDKEKLSILLKEAESGITREFDSFEMALDNKLQDLSDADRLVIFNGILNRLKNLSTILFNVEIGCKELLASRKRLAMDARVLRGMIDP